MFDRLSILIDSAFTVDFEEAGRPKQVILAWLAVILLQCAIWIEVEPRVVLLSIAAASVITYKTRCWPLLLLILYTLMEHSVLQLPNIYDREAGPDLLWPVRLGVLLFGSAWLAFGYTFPNASQPTRSNSVSVMMVPSRAVLLSLLFVASAVDIYRYRNTGVPLFSDQLDITRDALRADANLVLGLLREAWTLGLMLSVIRMLFLRRLVIIDGVIVIAFIVGALSGGSRNALLSGLIPALLTVMFIYMGAKSNTHTRRRPTKGILVAVFLSGTAAIVGAFYFAGQRVLSGKGTYERWIAEQTEGDAWLAALYSADLSLSAPLETWSRLFQHQSWTGTIPDQLNSFAAFGSIFEKLGYDVSLYEITARLSSPLYMNVGTFMAAPYVDYGLNGSLIFVAVLGALLGVIDRLLRNANSVFASMGRAYLIYVGVFAAYEFLPYFYPTWLPLGLGLAFLHFLDRKRYRPIASSGLFKPAIGSHIPSTDSTLNTNLSTYPQHH